MRREIQIHFENQGQLSWHEDIEDVEKWLRDFPVKMYSGLGTAHDKESGRYFAFQMSSITAIIIMNKTIDNEDDIYRRTYAIEEGKV